MKKETFSKGMLLIGEAFNKNFGKEYLAVAFKSLKDLTDEQFDYAVKDLLIHHNELYPNTNIVALIRGKITDLEKIGHPSPEEAWGLVREQISKEGFYGVPKFDNPIVAEAVEKMGWAEICNAAGGDAGTRAHFYRTYEAIQRRAYKFGELKVITGGKEIRGFIRQIVGKTE
jgi:hypothetical protein